MKCVRGLREACLLAVAGLVAVATAGAGACAGDAPSVTAVDLARVATVTVSVPADSLLDGDVVQALAVARNAQGTVVTPKAVLWRTSDPSIATVDAQGRVTGVAAGIAKISVVADSVSASANVRVTRADISMHLANSGVFLADTALFRVSVTSVYQLASVVVRIADRSATLTIDPLDSLRCGTCRSGTINLSGLAIGPVPATVTATDVRGVTRVLSTTLTHDNPPRIQIASPIDRTVGRPNVHVTATCTDDTGSCASFAVTSFDGRTAYAQSASGRIDQDIRPLQSEALQFVATDAAGQTTHTNRSVYVEDGTHLTELITVPAGQLVDVGGGKALFVQDSLNHLGAILADPTFGIPKTLQLRDATGRTTVIATDTNFTNARLTLTGAIYTTLGSLTDTIYEYRNGVTLTLSAARLPGGFTMEGNWAAWTQNGDLVVRDITGGTTTRLGSGVGSVADNGDAAWIATSGDVWWRHGGTIEAVTQDGNANPAMPYSFPLTGSGLLTFRRGLGNGLLTMILWSSGKGDTLSRAVPPVSPEFIAGGWVAFMATDSQDVLHVFSRSPGGVMRQVDRLNGTAILEALEADGTVVFSSRTFANDGRRFVSAPPYTSATDVGSSQGTVMLRDNTIIDVLGRTAFVITP